MNTGLDRVTTDKFYTNNDIVTTCINDIRNSGIIKKNDIIIEPSAGSGSFINEIKNLSDEYMFYDILPEHDEIIKQDFLQLDVEKFNNKTVHIIGNPPFGRQSSTAIKFIKYSCQFSKSVSFILPKSFKKKSMQKHFNEFFHLKFEKDLPINSFHSNDILYNVPCVFQIWVREEFPRTLEPNIEPVGFVFVKKNEDPDISFRRVGFYAGRIDRNINDKSEQSHYFIKFNNPAFLNLYNDFLAIKYDENNTVGPKSISKQEIIKKFNNVIQNV